MHEDFCNRRTIINQICTKIMVKTTISITCVLLNSNTGTLFQTFVVQSLCFTTIVHEKRRMFWQKM